MRQTAQRDPQTQVSGLRPAQSANCPASTTRGGHFFKDSKIGGTIITVRHLRPRVRWMPMIMDHPTVADHVRGHNCCKPPLLGGQHLGQREAGRQTHELHGRGSRRFAVEGKPKRTKILTVQYRRNSPTSDIRSRFATPTFARCRWRRSVTPARRPRGGCPNRSSSSCVCPRAAPGQPATRNRV